MAHPEGLISLADRTPEERSEIARKGQKASVETRNRRKTLREELLALLEKGNTQEKISVALIQQALDGNVKAFETIRDSIGEKCSEKVDVQSQNVIIDFGNIKGDE